jgi:hypothetical protein
MPKRSFVRSKRCTDTLRSIPRRAGLFLTGTG